MEHFKVPWKAQKLHEHGHLDRDLLHGTLYYATRFRANSWNPEELEL